MSKTFPAFSFQMFVLAAALAAFSGAAQAGQNQEKPECSDVLTALKAVDQDATSHPPSTHDLLAKLNSRLQSISQLVMSDTLKTVINQARSRVAEIELDWSLHPLSGGGNPYLHELMDVDTALANSMMSVNPAKLEKPQVDVIAFHALAELRGRVNLEMNTVVGQDLTSASQGLASVMVNVARDILVQDRDACKNRNQTTLDKYLNEHPAPGVTLPGLSANGAG